jgi:ABC-type antimicrobial peptide transport system permease subunit
VTVAVRAEHAGTQPLIADLREAVRSVSAMLPLAQPRTRDEVYGQSLARTSFTLVLLAVAGTMALLLGMSGIYAVIAYVVSRRRRELGIRLALGAQPADIRRLFVRRSLVLVVVGIVVGLGCAVGVAQLMGALVFGIEPLDPITFVATPAVLAAVTVLASYLPTRRAVTVDPIETLRAE